MTRKEATEHQITTLMTKAEQTFVHGGTVTLPKVIVHTVEDAWVSLCRDRDYARVDRLIAVAEFLIMRERTKFERDRDGWLKHQHELAAA